MAKFLRNAGETQDAYKDRFMADPGSVSLYPDDSQRGIAADAQWMEFENSDAEEEKAGMIKSMSEPAKAKNASEKCAACGHGHDGDVCDDCSCTIFTSIKNAIKPISKQEMEARPHKQNGDFVITTDDGTQWLWDDRFNHYHPWKAGDGPVKNMLETAVQNGMISSGDMQKLVTRDGYPKTSPPIKFLMPGLVEYEYMNDGNGARVLVTKNAIDKMLKDPEKSIVGKPVINIAHREVSPDDYKNGKADGVVTRAWWDPEQAWYCCEALVWDEDTRRNLINDAVSCEYTALPPWGPAGQLNQVHYDKEVTDGRFKHLAVVSGPRYEGATLMNSTGGNKPMTKLFQWLKKGDTEVKNSVDVDARTAVEIDGKEVPLENAITAWKEAEAAKVKAKAEADALALKNAKVLTDADVVTIDGKQVSVIDLKNALAEKVKNASEEKMEKDHKDGEHKDKDLDNCPMCNSEAEDEEKKEKDEKDAKNALLMNAEHRRGAHITLNEKCSVCDGIAAERLTNAAKQREGKLPTPSVPSVNDGLRKGKELMGKTRAQQEAAAAAGK